MPFKALPKETSTLLFKLPHISNLFVFKENFSNHFGMVQIVTEILRYGKPEFLHIGECEDNSVDYENLTEDCTDTAIIRVNLLENIFLTEEPEVITRLFIEELENHDNAITVDSNVIDSEINASTVDIVIAPVNSKLRRNEAA